LHGWTSHDEGHSDSLLESAVDADECTDVALLIQSVHAGRAAEFFTERRLCVENSDDFEPKGYRFEIGTERDAPILLPLPGGDCDLSSMMRFCREIRPGSPLLVTQLAYLNGMNGNGSATSMNRMADRLAAIIVAATRSHDLALIPIIVVGNAEGADLAACLALSYGSLLGACILLRPTVAASAVGGGTLSGLHVLLVLRPPETVQGSAGRGLCDALQKAGAEVICEQTPDADSLGPREAALAHVFAATLFGT
jgi:predicted esterase